MNTHHTDENEKRNGVSSLAFAKLSSHWFSGRALMLLIILNLAPSAFALSVGNRVQCTQNLNVRATASTSGTLVTTEPSGSKGTISSGPTTSGGFTWWNINWDNGYSGWSVQDYLVQIAAAPTITSVTPNPITADPGNAYQTLTINGTNFVNKPTLAVTWTGGGTTLSASQVTYVSSTQLTMSIKLGAVADSWTVRATNPDGQASSARSFTVNASAPAPTITSVTPNPITADPGNAYQTLTINGTNFVNKPTLAVTWTGGGTTLSASQVTYVTSTQLTMSIKLGAVADSWTVRATNPDGQSSSARSFTVNASAPAPTITSVTPNPITADPNNAYQTLTITGTNFVNKPTLAVTWTGGGTTLSSSQVTYVSSTQLTMSITLGRVADTWTVQATNPDGQSSSARSFTVNASAPAPSITAVTPNPITADPNNASQTLTITGTNFVNKPTLAVTWTGGGTTLSSSQVTYVSSTQLTMSITLGRTADIWTVQATNPDGQSSNARSFTVNASAPAPTITSVTPNPITADPNNAAQTLTITGTNFVNKPTLTVTWTGGGTTLSSSQVTYVSSTQLTMSITLGRTADIWTVQATNPDGQSSSARSFTVNASAPAPTITSVTPNPLIGSNSTQRLTISGSLFVATPTVRLRCPAYNVDVVKNASFVNPSQVTVDAIYGTDPAAWTISIINPSGAASNDFGFSVNAPAPVIGSISPASISAGGSPFTLSVSGTTFDSASVVKWNGSSRATTRTMTPGGLVTGLQAAIAAADIASVGNASVTVFTPSPGGGTSAPVTFSIVGSGPGLSAVMPATATGSNSPQTLTFTGSGFVVGSQVRLRCPTYNVDVTKVATLVSSTQLTVSATLGTDPASWTAQIITPSGAITGQVAFSVVAPVPVIGSLSPSTISAGGGAFTLLVSGATFESNSSVRVNGSSRPSTVVFTGNLVAGLQATISATDIATAGTLSITVFNPAPGGGTSSAVSLPVTAATSTSGGIKVTGRVIKASNFQPVIAAAVEIGSNLTLSNGSGEFELANVNLAQGNTLISSKPGYNSAYRQVSPPAGALSFDLGAIIMAEDTFKPIVERVQGSPGGLLLFGMNCDLTVTTTVNWNGKTPGQVRFVANDKTIATRTGSGPIYTVTVDVDSAFVSSLKLDANKVQVIAVASDGTASDAALLPVLITIFPSFLKTLDSVSFPFTCFPNYQIGVDFSFPANPLKKNLTLPVLGKFGIEFAVNGSFDYTINDGSWEFELGAGAEGTRGKRGRRPVLPSLTRYPKLKAYMGNREIAASVSVNGKGTATFAQGVSLSEVGGTASLEFKGELTRFGVLSVPVIGPALSLVPGVNSALKPVSVQLIGDIGGSGSLNAKVSPHVEFKNVELGTKLGLELKYEGKLSAIHTEIEATVGASGTGTFQYPGNLVKEVKFSGYAEAKITAFGFESGVRGEIDFTPISDTGNTFLGSQLASMSAMSIEQGFSDWKPMQRPWRERGNEQFALTVQKAKTTSAITASSAFAQMGQATSASGNGLTASMIASGGPAVAEVPLVTNVYPHSEPSLTERNGKIMLVFTRDSTSSNPTQFTQIAYSNYDGTTWTAPLSIAGVPNAQFAPQVRFDGNDSALAVWEQVRDANLTATSPQDIAPQLEIVWARWDAVAGSWTAAESLTDNAYLDHQPQLAGPLSDGDLLLIWSQNIANAMTGSGAAGADSNTTVMVARWDAATYTWGAPAPLVSSLIAETSVAISASGDKAVCLWTKHVGGDVEVDTDTEVFSRTYQASTNTWTEAARLTNDATADINASVFVDATGQVSAMWLRNTDLVVDRNLAGTPTVVRPNSNVMGFTDFAIAGNNTGNLLAIWQEQDAAGSNPHYRIYDPASSSWSRDATLSQDTDIERSFAPVWDSSGNLLLAYNNVLISRQSLTIPTSNGGQLTLDDVATAGQVDLCVTRKALIKDLKLTAGGMNALGIDFLPGDNITLSAKVTNSGDIAVQNVSIGFYDGDPANGGTLIGTVSIPSWLEAGAEQEVTLDWLVPQPATARIIYIVIDPANQITEFDELNNSGSFRLNGMDLHLSYQNGTVGPDGSARLVVTARNDGAPSTPDSTINLWSSSGALLVSAPVPALHPGKSVDLPLLLPAGTQPEGDASYRLEDTGTPMATDSNLQNNETTFTLHLVVDEDHDGVPRAWELANGFSDSAASDADTDTDGDGMTSKQEYLSGTNPRDSASRLHIGEFNSLVMPSTSGIVSSISWASVEGRVYVVERSFDLKTWQEVQTGIQATPPLNTITDEVPPPQTSAFYRVQVR